ncbi:hypothetical protein DEO72_LG3g564 [Vigna unguiculata]|uniref:Uncharacterized protein n=1 Tax=Vigna unguiculata TaxID=3917 RepID=A0A4D6LC25_VIGUN|nr:hypothetical protein DEO72_LG3g564 [Vigna unguiculata]
MGMSFKGNAWCFKDELDNDPEDAADASSSATRTHYEQEMLCMVTTLFDQHQTWTTKLESIEHQLTSVQQQLAQLNTGRASHTPEVAVDTVEGSESEQFEDATNEE